MKLIIVRHAEADHNVKSLLVGHGPSKLTARGKYQVERVAEKLRSEPIDVAFSSDSERALHTAQGILHFHPNIELSVSEELRERHMGDLEGKSRAEFNAAAKRSGVKWFEHRPTGGESMLETQKRSAQFIEKIIPLYRGKTVLIVSHGGFIRALLAYLLKHDYDAATSIRVANTAVTIVQLGEDQRHTAHVINDTTHLDDGEFT